MCDISVIVCTRNRGYQLAATLDNFNRLTFNGSWELILVDNGSTDNTNDVIETFQKRKNFKLLILQEPKPGLARSRNTGLSHARGEIVAFTDDDCYPDTEYLSAIYKSFSKNNIDYLGGRVLLFDSTDLRITIQEKQTLEIIEPFSFISSGIIHGANMAFRKVSLLRMNGFDERLGAGTRFKSGEDTDIIQRLSITGSIGIYDPEVCVYHHHGRKSEEEKRKIVKDYRKGIAALMLKYIMYEKTRKMYIRTWYRRLRSYLNNNELYYILFELYSFVEFYIIYGPTQYNIWNHPHERLKK